MSATTTSPTAETPASADRKGAEAFRTISEVAEVLKLPQHVLRFWETRFTQIKPLKRAGGRRFYRPQDVELLAAIRHLLYGEGYTIKGVQRILREQGPKGVAALVTRAPRVGQTEGELTIPLQDDALDPIPEEGGADHLAAPIAALRDALAELGECRRLLLDGVREG